VPQVNNQVTSIVISSSRFISNMAYCSASSTTSAPSAEGGMGRIWGALVNITASTFTNNSAVQMCASMCAASGTFAHGGALNLLNGGFNITGGTTFSGNRAYSTVVARGGAIIHFGTTRAASFSRSSFTDNVAGAYGSQASIAHGGVLWFQQSATSPIYSRNSVFTGNRAVVRTGASGSTCTAQGGVFYVIGDVTTNVIILSSNFTSNYVTISATSAAYLWAYGGALNLARCSASVDSSYLTNNSAYITGSLFSVPSHAAGGAALLTLRSTYLSYGNSQYARNTAVGPTSGSVYKLGGAFAVNSSCSLVLGSATVVPAPSSVDTSTTAFNSIFRSTGAAITMPTQVRAADRGDVCGDSLRKLSGVPTMKKYVL
jgi:hypothetical protein